MKKAFNLFLLVLLIFITLFASYGYLVIRMDDECFSYHCSVIINITFFKPVKYATISEGIVIREGYSRDQAAFFAEDNGLDYLYVFNGSYIFLDRETLLFVTGILWGITIRVLLKTDWKNIFKKKISILEEK